MKKIIILLITGALFNTLKAHNLPVFHVRLIQQGKVIANTQTSEELSFCFFLKKNCDYQIELSGKTSRIIRFTTRFGDQAPKLSFFKFYFKEALLSVDECQVNYDYNRACFYVSSVKPVTPLEADL